MAGTRAGGLKAAETNKRRYKEQHGPNADFYGDIGAKGGSKRGLLKGYAANPELAREAGRKGAKVVHERRAKGEYKTYL